jgi:hypothetical protein
MVVPHFMSPEEVFLIEENGKTAITNYICRLLMACSRKRLDSNWRNSSAIDQEGIFFLKLNHKYPDFDYPDVSLDSKFIIQEEQHVYQEQMNTFSPSQSGENDYHSARVITSIRLDIRYEYVDWTLRFSIGKTTHGMQYKCYTMYRNFNIQGHNALRDHQMWFLKNLAGWFYKTHFIYPFYRLFHMHIEEERRSREVIQEIPIIEEMKREILSFVPEKKWNIFMLYGGFKYFNILIMEGDLSIVKKDRHYATPFIHLMMDLSHPDIIISRFVKPFDSGFVIHENVVESIEEIARDKILQLEKVSSTDPHVILETMRSWMISHSYQGKYVEEEEPKEAILQELILS